MKQLQAEKDGRPFANDDFMTLQKELTDAIQAQFLGKGPFILSGCVVSGPATAAMVTAGIVCLDGQLLRFVGASGIALPAQFQADVVVQSDLRPYQTGGSKYCMREVPAVLVASDPTYTGGEFLPLDTWGGKTWAHVQRATVRCPLEVQPLGKKSYVAANYDTDGVGLPGTEAWGWALANGIGDTDDLRKLFQVGFDPTDTDYNVPGNSGGNKEIMLTIAQLPVFTPKIKAKITDDRNAGTNAGSFTAATNASPNANGKDITAESVGGGEAIDIRPKYYTMVYRQWIGY